MRLHFSPEGLTNKITSFSDDILLLLFNTPQSLLWGFLLIPSLEKGGEGGFFNNSFLPNDTPPSLRRGVFIVPVRVPKGKCPRFFVLSIFAINYNIVTGYIANRFATAFSGLSCVFIPVETGIQKAEGLDSGLRTRLPAGRLPACPGLSVLRISIFRSAAKDEPWNDKFLH